jgi:hypothetical protein
VAKPIDWLQQAFEAHFSKSLLPGDAQVLARKCAKHFRALPPQPLPTTSEELEEEFNQSERWSERLIEDFRFRAKYKVNPTEGSSLHLAMLAKNWRDFYVHKRRSRSFEARLRLEFYAKRLDRLVHEASQQQDYRFFQRYAEALQIADEELYNRYWDQLRLPARIILASDDLIEQAKEVNSSSLRAMVREWQEADVSDRNWDRQRKLIHYLSTRHFT